MVLTDQWVWESDLGSSYKGYTGYKEVLGGKDDIGGPNQANPEALAFILWCPKAISEWFENPVILGLINELGLTPLPPLQTMSAFLTVFFIRELPLLDLNFVFLNLKLLSNNMFCPPCCMMIKQHANSLCAVLHDCTLSTYWHCRAVLIAEALIAYHFI